MFDLTKIPETESRTVNPFLPSFPTCNSHVSMYFVESAQNILPIAVRPTSPQTRACRRKEARRMKTPFRAREEGGELPARSGLEELGRGEGRQKVLGSGKSEERSRTWPIGPRGLFTCVTDLPADRTNERTNRHPVACID